MGRNQTSSSAPVAPRAMSESELEDWLANRLWEYDGAADKTFRDFAQEIISKVKAVHGPRSRCSKG